MENNVNPVFDTLLTDIGQLITDARQRVVVAVNAEMTMLYWRVGKRINGEVLRGKNLNTGRKLLMDWRVTLSRIMGRDGDQGSYGI